METEDRQADAVPEWRVRTTREIGDPMVGTRARAVRARSEVFP